MPLPDFEKPPTPDYALAESVLEKLKDAHWSNEPDKLGMHAYGYTRAEQEAIDIVVKEAVEKQGMRALSDLAGNVYLIKEAPHEPIQGKLKGFRLATKNPAKTDVIVSHIDTVEKGGAHDGRDGIAAGLAVVSGFNKAGIPLKNDLVIMIARSEESCINGQVSIGAKLATGGLKPEQLHTLKNRKTHKSVFDHMQELGIPVTTLKGRLPCDPTLFPTGNDAKNLIGFLAEAHIEQGNYCAKQEIDVGIVTHIRGNTRFLGAEVKGLAQHSGAAFEEDRADAMRATVALMDEAEKWFKKNRTNNDVVFTISSINTTNASPTTTPDNSKFSFEIRSSDAKLLERFAVHMQKKARLVEAEFTNDNRDLKITLPPAVITKPATMDKTIVEHTQKISDCLGITTGQVISGAGHDTAQFANTGSPAVMVFIRQDNPLSHNPAEARRTDSFNKACDILAGMVMNPVKTKRKKSEPSTFDSFTHYLEQQGASEYTPGQYRK